MVRHFMGPVLTLSLPTGDRVEVHGQGGLDILTKLFDRIE
jgi:hypothetical protein